MITQNINIDADLNALSVEAQLLFIRILSVSDDCGVVPANEYELKSLTNPPDKIRSKFNNILNEIISARLLIGFEYNDKPYYCFKKESFEREQAYIIKNRTKSEYLKIHKDVFLALYIEISSLPENSGKNSNFPKVSSLTHREYKAKSNELQVTSKESKAKSGDFIAELIEIFCDAYQEKKHLEYQITNEGKERQAMGSLLAVYKKKKKDADTETVKQDFKNLFLLICGTNYKNKFLDSIELSKINSSLNQYLQGIQQHQNGAMNYESIIQAIS